MNLSPAQKVTVKSWLDANAVGQSDDAAAAMLNVKATPNYFVWLKDADKSVLDSKILKSAYTPTDAVPASPSTDMTYQNRALLCQLKQTNAIWLVTGTVPLDARLANNRTNLKDCLMQIPSGAAGADKDAGWGNPGAPGTVRLEIMRSVTVLEKMFVAVAAAGAGNVGGDARGLFTNPDIYGTDADGNQVSGAISGQQVSDIRGGV